jgi:hypothetical protein
MNGIDARVKAWLVWALPFAVIAALVGWETDWGHALKRVSALDSNIAVQPVPVALLPEYRIDGGIDSRRETIERTLFNPTRRPAPPQASAAAKPAIQPGQFVLTGTTVVDQKATAFLREVNGGRSRRVQQGETINGLLVAEVRADRVRLTSGDVAEELTLKVASGPKSTIQPQVAVAPPPPQPATPGAPQPGQNVAQPGQTPEVADVLATRRRAARAAEAMSQSQQSAQPTPPAAAPVQQAAPAQQTPKQGDPAWNDVYQRYIQRGQGNVGR